MEKAIYWFSRNHVAANLLMLGVIVMGVVSWGKLKKEIFPETSIDAVAIRVPYPNATPAEVERGICIPVEEAILDVNGIRRLSSTAAPSMGIVLAEVETGYQVRNVMDDIKTRVDAITNFPEEAETPVLDELVLNGEVLSVAISADTGEASLRVMAERLRDELTLLDEVTKVDLKLTRPYEISIEVSEATLRAYGLTFDQVTAAVRGSSLDLPAGSVRTAGGEILIRTESRRYYAPEFEEITVVTRPDGSQVKLGQIAAIVDGFEEIDIESEFDGRRAMLLTVFRVGNQDTLKVAVAVKKFITEEAPRLFPDNVKLEIWKDDSTYLKGRLELLGRNAATGFVLIIIVLSLFMRPALSMLVAISVPAAVLGTVALMGPLGVSINMISLFAFILVLGIVVDDSIIVGENVYHRIANGEHPKTAAPAGTHEVGVVVIFGVLTTMMAFTPMLGLSGVSGKIWPHIPLVVIPALGWSLLLTKFVMPSHLAMLRPASARGKGPTDRLLNAVDAGLQGFIRRIYQPVLHLSIRWRYVTLCAFVALVVAVTGMVATGWIKFQFFPEVEADVVIARLTLPEGVAFDTTRAAVQTIESASKRLQEEYIAAHGGPIIRHTLASSGSQPFQQGFDQIGGAPTGSNLGEVTIELTPGAGRKLSASEIASRWRELTGAIPGALELTFQTQAAGGGNAIDLEISGNNIAELEDAAAMIKDELAAFQGVIDIADNNRPGKRELKLAIKPGGEILGLRLADISRQARQAFYGDEAQRLQRGRDEVKVMIRYPEAERQSINNLADMKIRAPDGSEIPFSAVADFDYGHSASSIQRAERRRAIKVTADIDKAVEGANANEVVAALMEKVFPKVKERFPGVQFGFQGEQKDQRQSVQEMAQKSLIAMLGVYVLLAIPLRSYLQPFIIMSVIPFGIIGAVFGHMLLGLELSIMSMCGVVALSGIVINDSLIMVEFVNRERAAGHDGIQAALEAGARRFRPIFLTSATTFAGLMPMLFETDIQARFLIPMAVSLGFGVVFATLITLLLIPAIYLILEDLKHFLFGKRADDSVKLHEAAPGVG